MNKKEKILLGTTALLGTALGISIHKNIQQQKNLNETKNSCNHLLEKINRQEAELLQKRGNMHFVKNCLGIIKSFAEDAEESENAEERLNNIVTANQNTIQSIDLIKPLLEHLTYATNNISSNLFEELKHLKVFMRFVKIRSENNCEIKYTLNDNVKPYIKYNICCCILTELLENAFKHSYLSADNNTISIDIKMADDDYMLYKVSNPIYQSKTIHDSSSPGGMGINNIKERLSLYYQNMFEISSEEKNGRYECKLIVKLLKK
ncbi:GHKL domain-containing protein [Labilibaculum sp.]|uniref:GHKL domain-containing protein n=1 Tax=Labilibaculum sp. TaxID=2060723 RepID=UPI002AA774F8|nr:GHKL domain-containing protein [Labilibaculum sp.]